MPPSEVDRLTVDQFDIACAWIDQQVRENADATSAHQQILERAKGVRQ